MGIFSRLKSVFSKPYTRVGVTEAKALVNSGATVINARSTAESRTGRIPAAKHVPPDRLKTSNAGIRKDRPVIAVCQSGARSAIAARQLAERGYNAYSLSGGIGAWRRSGEPTP